MSVRRHGRVGTLAALAAAILMSVTVFGDPRGPAKAVADGEPVAGFGVDGVMIDRSFSAGSSVDTRQVFQLATGMWVVTGYLRDAQGGLKLFIARYLADGKPDTSFGSGGVLYPTLNLGEMVALADGRLAAVAHSDGNGIAFIDLDGSISVNHVQWSFPLKLMARPDGGVILVFYGYGPTAPNRLTVAMNPDGTFDRAYGGDITAVLPAGGRLGGYVPTATFLADGRLAVGFSFTAPNALDPLCGVVALGSDGRPDPTFGDHGLAALATQPHACSIDRFAGDTIRVLSWQQHGPTVLLAADGTQLGTLAAPFDIAPVAVEGTGYLYTRGDAGKILGYDPQGEPDPTFGVDGLATVPGVDITGFELVDSGDIVVWGTATGDPTALALGLIDGSYGTAPQPPLLDTTAFVPVTPTRVLDTRNGTGAPLGTIAAGGTVDVSISDAVGVAVDDVSAVVLNITATESAQAGYVTAYPSGSGRPWASNLNVNGAGQPVANLVTVAVGGNGKVTLFSSTTTHLVADIAGYYTPALWATDGRLQTAPPARILDTRVGVGAPQAKIPSGGQIDLQVTGAGPVPTSGVEAVVLNVTGDDATLDGYVTIWPAGTPRPLASNLNLTTGGTRANLVIAPLSADGRVSLFTSGGADLIGDVAGWFTSASAEPDSVGLFVPITPTRVLDTRNEHVAPTAPQSSLTRRIGSTIVVPPDASIAVAANITATATSGAGYITVWPAHTDRPIVSNINAAAAGQTIANAVIVPLGQNDVSVFTQSGTHIVIDIEGWYTNF